ncbi:hypothetical protein BHF45_20520 [Escherichia coli]|nr:hypothetical protein BHF45_20520 [Escherichia coli]
MHLWQADDGVFNFDLITKLNVRKEKKMSTLFIFGAGASFGSEPVCDKAPLGYQLIAQMQKMGGVAGTITGELKTEFEKNPEKGMDLFFEKRPQDITALLVQMAEFFCQFQISQDNTYVQLIKKLSNRKYVFSTTNYDLLIEQAAAANGKLLDYGIAEHHSTMSLLKIHGSCNFIPPEHVYSGYHLNGCVIDYSTVQHVSEYEPFVARDIQDIIKYCKSNPSIGPALAIYHPEKRVLHASKCIEEQQHLFKEEIKKSKKIFIIGLSVNPADTHIWQELHNTKADLYYVDTNPNAYEEWSKTRKTKNSFIINERFENSLNRISKILHL